MEKQYIKGVHKQKNGLHDIYGRQNLHTMLGLLNNGKTRGEYSTVQRTKPKYHRYVFSELLCDTPRGTQRKRPITNVDIYWFPLIICMHYQRLFLQ